MIPTATGASMVCSFCLKPSEKALSGETPGVCICPVCVSVCVEVLLDPRRAEAGPGSGVAVSVSVTPTLKLGHAFEQCPETHGPAGVICEQCIHRCEEGILCNLTQDLH